MVKNENKRESSWFKLIKKGFNENVNYVSTFFPFIWFCAITLWGLFYVFVSTIFYSIYWIFYSIWKFFRSIFKRPKFLLLLVGLIILFGLGIGISYTQPGIQTFVDIAYECGAYPVLQTGNAFLHTILKGWYEFVVVPWNDAVLYIRESIIQLIDDIRLITDLETVAGISELLTLIYEELKTIVTFELYLPSWRIPWLTDALSDLWEVVECYTDYFFNLLLRLSTFTLINSDCDFCLFDPTQTCTLRKDVIFGSVVFPQSTCTTQCFDFIGDFWHCNAKFIKLFVSKDNVEVRTKIDQIASDVVCILNTVVKRFSWIISGLIDHAINSNNCVTPGDLFSGPEWIPVTFETLGDCLDSLIDHLTNGVVGDFFEMILSFLFEIVHIVTISVEGIAECHSLPEVKTCFDNWPYDGLGTGRCAFSGSNTIPTGGIHQCFQLISTCMGNETNIPLLDDSVLQSIIQFIYVDVTKMLDFVVCPFAALGSCSGVTPCSSTTDIFNLDLDQLICDTTCVKNNIPLLSPFASAFLTMLNGLDSMTSTINGYIVELNGFIDDIEITLASIRTELNNIADIFKCIGRCNTVLEFLPAPRWLGGCLSYTKSSRDANGCLKRDLEFEFDLSNPEHFNTIKLQWREVLVNQSISKDTYCGNLLDTYIYPELENKTVVDRMLYATCYNTWVISTVLQKSCPNITDLKNRMLNFNDNYNVLSEISTCMINKYNLTAPHIIKLNSTNTTHQEGKRSEPLDEKQFNQTIKAIEFISRMKNNTFGFFRDFFQSPDNSSSSFKRFIFESYTNLRDSSYAAVTRNYMFEYRKAVSQYDDALYILENDPNKGEMQKEAEKSEIESMQNKVLLRMTKTYWSQIRQIRKGRRNGSIYSNGTKDFIYLIDDDTPIKEDVIQLPQEGDEDQQQIAKRGLKIERNKIVIEVKNYQLTFLLAKPKHGSFRKRNIGAIQQTVKVFERKKEEFTKRAEETSKRISDRAPVFNKLWTGFQKRGYFPEKNSIMKWSHMFLHVIISKKNESIPDMYAYMKGEKDYVPTHGFLTKEQKEEIEQYEYEDDRLKRNTVNNSTSFIPEGSLFNVLSGKYNSRKPQNYSIFLWKKKNESMYTIGLSEVAEILKRIQYQKNRDFDLVRNKLLYSQGESLHLQQISDEFQFNEWFLGFLDSILDFLSMFWSNIGPFFVDFWNKTIAFFEEWIVSIDVVWEEAGPKTERFFTCKIPEDINGTNFYNPFCFPILPEALFKKSIYPTASSPYIPAQIPWPSDLIARPCVNTFNGDDYLFSIKYSDNCANVCPPESRFSGSLFFSSDEDACQTNPNTCCRPLCSKCDYCSRDYFSCKQKGFEDSIDSLFFAFAFLSRTTSNLLVDGLTLSTLDGALVLIIIAVSLIMLVVSIVISLVYILPSFGLGIVFPLIAYIPITLFFIFIEKLIVWILVFIFPDLFIPWPIFILILYILISGALRIVGWKFPTVINFIVYAYISLHFFTIILNYYLDKPLDLSESLNLIAWTKSLFTWIQNNGILSSIFPWSSKVLIRLAEYDYPVGTPIPTVDTFCFFVTLDNLALLFIIFFFLPLLFLILFSVLYAIGYYFIFGLINWFFNIYVNLRTYWNTIQLRKQQNELNSIQRALKID